MPPRIRLLLPRRPFAREDKAPAAPDAPQVFREFVETLQRLDPPRPKRPQKRRYAGNGHRRPSPRRTRSRP